MFPAPIPLRTDTNAPNERISPRRKKQKHVRVPENTVRQQTGSAKNRCRRSSSSVPAEDRSRQSFLCETGRETIGAQTGRRKNVRIETGVAAAASDLEARGE